MKKKILYIEIIRILACFLVLVNHTNGFVLNEQNFANSLFYSIGFAISKIGVALFFMITGVLLLNKSFNFKNSLKSIFRVIVPLIGLSLILYLKNNGIENFNIFSFLSSIYTAPAITAYWYIYALIGVYLSIPFLQKMIKNFTNKDYIYFIILFLLVPSISTLIYCYFNLNAYDNLFMAFFPSVLATLICGNFIAKVDLKKTYFIKSIAVFIVSFISMFCSVFLPYLLNGQISYILDCWNSLPVLGMAISLFYIIRYVYETKSFSNKTSRLITIIGSTTFGIYLIHGLINYKIYHLRIFTILFNFNGIVATLILDVILFALCFIIILILKHIPIIKRFI